MHCGLGILTDNFVLCPYRKTNLVDTNTAGSFTGLEKKENNSLKDSRRQSPILSISILQPGREDSSHLLQEVFRVDAHT